MTTKKAPPKKRDIIINVDADDDDDSKDLLRALSALEINLTAVIHHTGERIMALDARIAADTAQTRANVARLTALIADILARPTGPSAEDLAELAAAQAELTNVGTSVPPPPSL